MNKKENMFNIRLELFYNTKKDERDIRSTVLTILVKGPIAAI